MSDARGPVAQEVADEVRALGTVRVVGTGLLGTSIALGLRSAGGTVLLADPSPTALSLAHDLGAGDPDDGTHACDLVVVAAPPDVTGEVVLGELAAHPGATVTDVASVKALVADQVAAGGGDLRRYVGSHPMAGRERSGPMAARGDLFVDRPWVVCPGSAAEPARVRTVHRLAVLLGATTVTMPARAHDEAVAVVSHLPQVAASLVAARLQKIEDGAVALAGGGLRDVTRIAASDPGLWAQILAANASPVLGQLRALREDLDGVIDGLQAIEAGESGGRAAVARAIAEGNVGRERIPGKHGGSATRYSVVTVVVPDRPGQLARLFADIGAAGVNVEELSLEHAAGRAVGLVEVSVLPQAQQPLEQALAVAGWQVVA